MLDRDIVKFFVKKIYNSDSWKQYLQQAKNYRKDQRYTLNSSFSINSKMYTMGMRLHDNGKDIVVLLGTNAYIFSPTELTDKKVSTAKTTKSSKPKTTKVTKATTKKK